MALEYYLNNYQPTVAGAGINNSSTSLTVSVAASIASGFRILVGTELMTVTAGGTTTTWTVTRGVESTIAAAHSFGDVINVVLTAGTLNNLFGQRQTFLQGYVQSDVNDGLAITTLNNCTAGNMLIVFTNTLAGSATPTCNDSLGTSYTRITTKTNGSDPARLSMFYGVAPSSAANTITITSSGATSGVSVTGYAEMKLWTTYSGTFSGTTTQSTSVTTNTGDLVVAVSGGDFFNHGDIVAQFPLTPVFVINHNSVSIPMTLGMYVNATGQNSMVIPTNFKSSEPAPMTIAAVFPFTPTP
jgi:hypothetical protein